MAWVTPFLTREGTPGQGPIVRLPDRYRGRRPRKKIKVVNSLACSRILQKTSLLPGASLPRSLWGPSSRVWSLTSSPYYSKARPYYN